MTPKLPVSVLVVVHTPQLDVLLIERAQRPGFWQSVTGSLDRLDEPPAEAALREVREETGIAGDRAALSDWRIANVFEIYPHWRHRFAPGTTHNTEHVFGLVVPGCVTVTLAPDEHVAHEWMPWKEAEQRCFSWTNRDAIRRLPQLAASLVR